MRCVGRDKKTWGECEKQYLCNVGVKNGRIFEDME